MKYITGKPNIPNTWRIMDMIQGALDRQTLTNNGPLNQRLEEKFSAIHDGAECISFCNATVALETVFRLKHKVKWIEECHMSSPCISMPSFTFIASFLAINNTNLNYWVDWQDIDDYYQMIYNPRGVDIYFPVNLFGSACLMPHYEAINQEDALDWKNTVQDNAQALGVKYKGQPLSNYAHTSVYSLHATKLVNAVEAGMVVTKDKDFANRLREYRNFGYKVDAGPYGEWNETGGSNYKLSELHAAVGIVGLDYLKDIIDKNQENYEYYKQYLPDFCKLITFPQDVEPNYSYIVIRVPQDIRNSLLDHLYENGIYARKYFDPPCHQHPAAGCSSWELPNTEQIRKEVICLPTGLQIDKEGIIEICNTMSKIKAPI